MVAKRYQGNYPEKGETHRTFTLRQIKCHDSPDDLWMVIYNKVYDITTFTSKHPGTAEILFDCGGVDATEAFEDVAHSDDAFQMLAPYFIGELISDECRTYNVSRNPSSNIDFANNDLKKIEIPKKEQYKFKLPTNLHDTFRVILLMVVAIISVILYLSIQKMKCSSRSQL